MSGRGEEKDREDELRERARRGEEEARLRLLDLPAAGLPVAPLGVTKAYLLPKEHALHVPPHVALSKLEDQVGDAILAITELQKRNYEKDKGKQFEGSYTRVCFIMIITYFTLCGYMIAIDVQDPFLNAIVPTVGFNLSTWSLPWVKQIWMGLYDYNWGKPVEFKPEFPVSKNGATLPQSDPIIIPTHRGSEAAHLDIELGNNNNSV